MAATARERQDQKNSYLRTISAEGRDIAPLPKVVDQKRRDDCRSDFKAFCLTYFAALFDRDFSEDHLKVIAALEDAVLRGGQAAIAMPRAYGKTTLCRVAVLWAAVYGHRRYVLFVGATSKHAENNLKTVKQLLDSTDLLLEDFPEVCYPIRKLEGIHNKTRGQTLNGKPTQIEWQTKRIALPNVDGSAASGTIIDVEGITGAIRGRNAILVTTGESIRPDLVIVDDPQTKGSAASARQNNYRLEVIQGDILGLAGNKERIAAFAIVTVIERGDMADQMLDRKRFPQWRGQRYKMMPKMPTNLKRWDEYAEVWADCQRQETPDLAKATAFYLKHRKELDAGAVVSWDKLYYPDEASAIQHAMNRKLAFGDAAFASEYQNEPLGAEGDGELLQLKTAHVLAKISKAPKLSVGIVPAAATKLVAFIDVQKNILFYCVAAVDVDFGLHVVEYGTYPKQARNYYGLRELKPTLQDLLPHSDLEGQLTKGLTELTELLVKKDWLVEDGKSGVNKISRILIDSGWGDSSTIVKNIAKTSVVLMSSKGVGISAKRKSMLDYEKKPGERLGHNWLYRNETRIITYDTNAWKTFSYNRILQAVGSKGALSLYHAPEANHKLFAEHQTSERGRPTTDNATHRTVNEWELLPNRENHFLDCLVGCYVAASEQGAGTEGHKPTIVKRQRYKATF